MVARKWLKKNKNIGCCTARWVKDSLKAVQAVDDDINSHYGDLYPNKGHWKVLDAGSVTVCRAGRN